MSAVIQASGLGKSYQIAHRTRGNYETLRDRVAGIFTLDDPVAQPETFWALQDVDFDVRQGEKLGVVGANGAGKSTLLKILSRITAPTAGSIRLRGRVGSLLEVGTGFHPELTGRENIFMNGVLLGMRRKEVQARFDQIVAFADVERFLDTPVKRYSSGMYTRLAFSVAAHLDSDILLLDEVLAVGDAIFQKKCLNRIDDMTSQGRTVLLVSHNMASIQSICDRALLLEAGRVVLDASVDQVVERYLHGFRSSAGRGVPVENRPRQGELGQKARLLDCSIRNAQGEDCEKLLFGERFSIHMRIRGGERLRRCSLLAGIDSVRSAERITTVVTDYADIAVDPQADEVDVSVAIKDLTLRPGLYSVLLSIRQGRAGLDHVPMAQVFEVLPLSSTGDVNLSPDIWGVVHSEGEWYVDRSDRG